MYGSAINFARSTTGIRTQPKWTQWLKKNVQCLEEKLLLAKYEERSVLPLQELQ